MDIELAYIYMHRLILYFKLKIQIKNRFMDIDRCQYMYYQFIVMFFFFYLLINTVEKNCFYLQL